MQLQSAAKPSVLCCHLATTNNELAGDLTYRFRHLPDYFGLVSYAVPLLMMQEKALDSFSRYCGEMRDRGSASDVATGSSAFVIIDLLWLATLQGLSDPYCHEVSVAVCPRPSVRSTAVYRSIDTSRATSPTG